MPPRIFRIPFADNLLQRLAVDLLGSLPGADSGDLTGGLVLLPSSRACRTLQHELLEKSGRNTMLLPRIVTVTQWAGEMAAALGLTSADHGSLEPFEGRPRLAQCCEHLSHAVVHVLSCINMRQRTQLLRRVVDS